MVAGLRTAHPAFRMLVGDIRKHQKVLQGETFSCQQSLVFAKTNLRTYSIALLIRD